jgi:hypothetical protein
MPQPLRRERGEPLRQLDHRPMREPGEQHVRQCVELRAHGGIDARIGVAEQIHPPRAHGIEVAIPVEVGEPRTLAACDGHERQRLVHLHLRARMPHRFAATG